MSSTAGRPSAAASVAAGQIGKLWGLGDVQIGDTIGAARTASEQHHFAPPTLETVITARHRADKGALHAALAQLAEQDPLINLRQDEVGQEIFVSLYGEVQKEVIQETLASEFGIDVELPRDDDHLHRATRRHRERSRAHRQGSRTRSSPPSGCASSRQRSALAWSSGSRSSSDRCRYAFFKAVEDTVHETLQQGLHGWQVTDCMVTMTHSGYCPRQSRMHGTFDKSMSSTGGDFRNLTPLVLMDALQQAGTTVFEPMHRFHLERAGRHPGSVLPAAGPAARRAAGTGDPGRVVHPRGRDPGRPGARASATAAGADSWRGRAGVRLRPLPAGPRHVPNRPRPDHNPLNRKEYLLHVVRKV